MQAISSTPNKGRRKFLIGGFIIIVAVIYLIASSTIASAQFFFTVDELKERGDAVVGKPLRVSGAVLGETVQYDTESLTLTFNIVHLPADNELINNEGGLAAALHAAVLDEGRNILQVEYIGVKPDLLRHEAQAILTGELGEDGIFYANELLLRCPTRYEEAVPDQIES